METSCENSDLYVIKIYSIVSMAKKDVLCTSVLLTGTANLPFSIPCIPVIVREILLNIYSLCPLCTWSYTYQINFEEIGSVAI